MSLTVEQRNIQSIETIKNRYCLFLTSAENLSFQANVCFTEIDNFETIYPLS